MKVACKLKSGDILEFDDVPEGLQKLRIPINKLVAKKHPDWSQAEWYSAECILTPELIQGRTLYKQTDEMPTGF